MSSRTRSPLLAVFLSLVVLGCINVDLALPIGSPGELEETVLLGDDGPKILLLEVDGVITEEPEERFFGPGESPVARLREELDAAREDDEIRALLVRIDSPGGTVTASDILYDELRRFKAERGVPVIAHFMGVAASGGYYLAMAADEIVAQPTTVTGSIGVIFGGVNLAGLLEKIGVENQTLVSGSFKDAGSLLRRMTPAERSQLQSVLDDMYDRFLDVVASGRRELAREDLERLADGRIYSAQQALELGLVDRLGGLADAIEVAETRAGLSRSRLVTYHRSHEDHANFYSVRPGRARAWIEPPLWSRLPSPSFLYLWTPGTL
jgi:protease-4